jgi:hypothetical protein
MAGPVVALVPAISLRDAPCPPKRDRRIIRAFTPVFDGLCPAMTAEGLSPLRITDA